MAKNNYYVVINNNKISIYNTWEECYPNVNKVKRVIYKGCVDEKEVSKFILSKTILTEKELIKMLILKEIEYKSFDINALNRPNLLTTSVKSSNSSNVKYPSDALYIYVDGSFNKELFNFSYGVVVVFNDEIIYEDYGVGNDPEASKLYQVCGEIKGSMVAVELAKLEGAKDVVICYDYKGIELWAISDSYKGVRSFPSEKPWKAKNPYTKEYKEFMLEQQKYINIHFKKIAAHTGEKYNERADKLAKLALSINK